MMKMWMVMAAALSGLAGAWLMYLASPQQRWLAHVLRPARLGWLGALCLLMSLGLLLSWMGSMAAVATWLVLAMLAWTTAPFLGAWRAQRRRSVP